jgi:two-component system KDP operon response regulator KdpE
MNQETARKKQVLIVDDEPRIGRILSLQFRLSGYEPISANSGLEALEIIGKQHLDLLMLDIVMPDMDGFQVLEKLRTFSQMPVIAFSARSENGPKAREMGANDFLTKPFDIADVVARVKRMLGDGV